MPPSGVKWKQEDDDDDDDDVDADDDNDGINTHRQLLAYLLSCGAKAHNVIFRPEKCP